MQNTGDIEKKGVDYVIGERTTKGTMGFVGIVFGLVFILVGGIIHGRYANKGKEKYVKIGMICWGSGLGAFLLGLFTVPPRWKRVTGVCFVHSLQKERPSDTIDAPSIEQMSGDGCAIGWLNQKVDNVRGHRRRGSEDAPSLCFFLLRDLFGKEKVKRPGRKHVRNTASEKQILV